MSALLRYFAKDIWVGWRASPFVVGAKLMTIALLTGAGTVILVCFHVFVEEARLRLEQIGARSMIIRRGPSPGHHLDNLWLEDVMNSAGAPVWHHFDRLILVADTELGDFSVPVFSIDPEDRWFQECATGAPAVLLTNRVPGASVVDVRVGAARMSATTRNRNSWVERVGPDPLLLISRDRIPRQGTYELERIDYVEIAGGKGPMLAAVSAIETLAREAGERSLVVQHPLAILEEIERLQATQRVWEYWIVMGFGGALALVMGAISALEYREQRYVGALLRSFGVHPAVVVLRHWVEAALLGNAGLLAAAWIALGLAPLILGSLGVPASATAQLDAARFWATNGPALVGFVNTGCLLSVIPVALAGFEEIGRVLQ
jgi:hypothetical protein